MKETLKMNSFRIDNGYDLYFIGHGIDIGCGDDLLNKNIFKNITDIHAYDVITDKNYDANSCDDIEDNKYDFVYSSHCLEHMKDPYTSYKNWIRICKPGGYLVVAVPHEIFYEKCIWPSLFNFDHKTSWTYEFRSNLSNSINIIDFLKKFDRLTEIVSIKTILENFDFNRFNEDQTQTNAICQIEFVTKKV
jgi:predicted SAM-dependent methyltransferase